MADVSISKFVQEKLKEGYSPGQIKDFLISKGVDKALIDKLIGSYARIKKPTLKPNKYKLLFLIVVPLILTLICTPFFIELKSQAPLSFETEQKTITTLEEECFKVLSELIKTHFDISLDVTYEEFLEKASTISDYRNFSIDESNQQMVKLYWKSYTFGIPTSLHREGIPPPRRDHMLHLNYNEEDDFMGCSSTKAIPAGKYNLMSLDSGNVHPEFETEDYSRQTIETNFGSFDLRLYKKKFFDNQKEDMYYISVISLVPEESRGYLFASSQEEFYTFKELLLEQRIKKGVYLGLFFLSFVAIMYFLNKFYLKKF